MPNTNNPELESLDLYFSTSTTMHVNTYNEKRAEILSRAVHERGQAAYQKSMDGISLRCKSAQAETTAPAQAETPDESAMMDDTSTCTRGFLFHCLAILSPAIGKEIRKSEEKLLARIKALEARPSMKYVGIYRDGIGYEPASVCTHDGSMFHCERATTARPGTSDDWVLCVKHGRDLR